MSTRVQKGSTVFRPVAKTRPRPAESTSTPSISQGNRISHEAPLSGAPEDTPAVITSQLSSVVPQALPQGRIDYAIPMAIANTTKQGVPTIVSSSIPVAQSVEPRAPPSVEDFPTSASLGFAIIEQTPQHQSKRRSRSRSLAVTSPKKSRKVRQPATPAFGIDAVAGEDLDPTSVTMAALCEDTGQGRISSRASQILDNHLAWKRSNKEKRARMRLRMESKKFGGNDDSDNAQAGRPGGGSEQIPAADETPGPLSQQRVSANPDVAGDMSGQGFDYSQNVSTSRYNVQVRIGPSGETIVDEESLFVDRNAEEDTTEYTHVEESDVTKFVNSGTYSKRFRGSRWSAEETELFYNGSYLALSQFGENYELISYVLPGRDRKACKNKFKSEDKKNPQRINYCLKNRKPYDMQTLSRMTGKDFSGPTPEIRAPAVVSFEEPRRNSERDQLVASSLREGFSSTTTKHAEEVVGDISNFNPE